ncbi:MAG TPA: NAD(P)-dependent oxidoreductase [Rhizobiales bacterium]|nr:NAD(P)-dependent oxidoreductase [Hyphomicrobiales bacterium]
MEKLAIIGFGEAGQAFVEGWGENRNFEISAYDIKTDSGSADAKWRDYEAFQVTGCATVAEAVKGADVVFSLVTADQANKAACSVAEHISPDTFFFDGNSCAPETKKQSATAIDGAGGLYVDMAIVAPVHPALNKVAMLLSGAFVEAAADIIAELDLSAKNIKGPVGTASAIKMTRSVMMKGLEALMIECVLAGRKAGVEDVVLDSLEATYPGFGWKDRAAYMFERVMTHGIRRAAEMREVAITVDDLDLDGTMAHATVDWHQRIGDLGLDTSGYENRNYQELADIVLEKLGS